MPRRTSRPFLTSFAHHASDPFRLLVESVVDYAIYIVDPAENIASWNPAAERIYGYRAEEIVGKPFTTVCRPEDIANGEAEEVRLRTLAEGHYDFECQRLRKDGSVFWAVVSVSDLKDFAGNHAGFSVVTRDISERKAAEDAVRQERDFSAALLGSLPGVYYVYDMSGKFLRWNRLFETTSGYSPEEIATMHPLDFFAPPDRERVAARIDDVFANGWSEVEAEFIARDGRRTAYYFNGVRAEFAGEPCLLGMGIDITSRQKAHKEAEEQRALLRVASRVGRMGAWAVELSTRKVTWSEEILSMLGLPADHSPGFEFGIEIYLPEYREHVRTMFERCAEHGAPFDMEVQSTTASGGAIWVRIIGEASRDTDGTIVAVHGAFQDISDRKRAEETLQLRDRAIQAVSQGILITDPTLPDNPITFASAGFERLTGYSHEEVLGRSCHLLNGPDTDEETVQRVLASIAAGKSCTAEIVSYRKDGTAFWNQITLSPVLDAAGKLTHFVQIQTDVTERRRLEEQYRQAQKMEAVGQLAGGVAHDFNNLLTVINGYSQLLLSMVSDPSARDMLTQVYKAGEQAGTLTRQLLAFSRQQVLAPRIVALNDIVNDTEKMLRRLIGEDIVLTTTLDAGVGDVKADPGQIEQVLINLAVNARDAMPRGGQLTIETQSVRLDETYCAAFPDLEAGEYTLLAVSDNGSGMDEKTRAHIFEPFFTTKALGHGTGLGLATVHGIVKQSRGHISVYSEPGLGTTFKVYLPHIGGALIAPRNSSGSTVALGGAETILLVEDDDDVRELASHILGLGGYRVIDTSNGEEAIRLAGTEAGPIHLLLSDVVMPHWSGRALAERITSMRPECRVLFMSGYTDDAVIRHGVLEAEFAFLQKPFSPSSLGERVRGVLDAPAAGAE